MHSSHSRATKTQSERIRRNHRMFLFMDTNHAFLLLLATTIFSSFHPKLSRAQRNNTSSSNACRCGAFGICDLQGSTICTCLPGFNPSPEWASGNWSSGCFRRTPLKCERNNNKSREDGFLKLNVVNATTGFSISGFSHRQFGQQNECAGICLRFCECMAYGYDFSTLNCLLWSGSLIDMQKSLNVSGSEFYIRMAGSELDRYKGGFKKIIIIPIVAGFISACFFTCVLSKWMSKKRGRKRRCVALGKAVASGSVDSSLGNTLDEANLEELPLFKFEILANATDNFSDDNKLGMGGFGPVYKGELGNGRKVAVKRLSKASGQGRQEFMNEVVLISKLQHRNLVRLLGCCVESEETMLVYEYMPNKSLDFFLFDSSQEFLDWGKRFNIIKGICRGLLYLHRDSRLKIIHRDLKPSNILLDNDWNPKISDFGMARIYGTEEDHISTVRVVGTYGYMAPEYAMEGRFSEKSDVFSFGVLMLEIATGRKNKSFNNGGGAVSLLAHVWKLWNEDNVVASIDPRISSPGNQAEIVRCIHIGLLCVQELPRDRPSVSSLLSLLRSEIVELPKLKPPAFTLKSRIFHTPTTYFQQSDQSSCSLNTVTLSVVDGR